MHLLQGGTLFQGVHRRPETIKSDNLEFFSAGRTNESVRHQIIARMEIVKDLPPQHEVSAVDPHVHVRHALNAGEVAVIIGLDDVERVLGRYRQQ